MDLEDLVEIILFSVDPKTVIDRKLEINVGPGDLFK